MKKLIAIVVLVFVSSNVDASDRLMNIIMSSPADYYVLQVASVSDTTDLKLVVDELGINKQLVAVKTIVEEEPRWVILEGIYKTYNEADYASQKIKAKDNKIKPWPRTIGSLKRVLSIRSVSK